MGLMDRLSSLAAGPVGQTLGGFLEGEIEEQRLEQELLAKKDADKAALVSYASKGLIDSNINNINTANIKLDAIKNLKGRGIPNYIIYEMNSLGLFDQDNPNNALNSAQELWGDGFWMDESNPYHQKMIERSGQYEFPDVSSNYKNNISNYQNQINKILNTDFNMTENVSKIFTQIDTAPGQKEGSKIVEAGTDVIPPLPLISTNQTYEVDQSQTRMARENVDFLVTSGFRIDRENHFTADGEFNWAALYAEQPEAQKAVQLFESVLKTPFTLISSGKASDAGLQHMATAHIDASSNKILSKDLVNTVGILTSDVINAIKEKSNKELIIERIRANNPDVPIATSNDELIKYLNNANANWVDTYNNLFEGEAIKSVINRHPFQGVQPLDFLFEEKNNQFELTAGSKLTYLSPNDYKDYSNIKLNETLYNPREPVGYMKLRDIHSEYYGASATLSRESGISIPQPDMPITGTSRATVGVGGPTAEQMVGSNIEYLVPNAVRYKKDKANIDYAPIEGMGETTSVLLSGTAMSTIPQIEGVLKDFVGDTEGLEQYVLALLLEQQQNGLLPEGIPLFQMEAIRDSVLDDIFEYEYDIKENISEAQGSIDDTDLEETNIKNLTDNIITDGESFPTEITELKNEKESELKKKQEERRSELDAVLDNATAVVDNAKKFMEDNKSQTYEEKREIAKDREDKVIDWFKNIFKGE